MLRDGHVDGPGTDVTEVLVFITVVTATCEPEASVVSSNNATAAKACPHKVNMFLSSLLSRLFGRHYIYRRRELLRYGLWIMVLHKVLLLLTTVNFSAGNCRTRDLLICSLLAYA